MAARRRASLSSYTSSSLTPALSPSGQWLDVPFSTSEFARAFRSVLLRNGHSIDELDGIGAHSLKTTLLSWCAKYGVPRETRRILGYHALPGDRSMDAYARAPMAGPLRELVMVVSAVREGGFNP